MFFCEGGVFCDLLFVCSDGCGIFWIFLGVDLGVGWFRCVLVYV